MNVFEVNLGLGFHYPNQFADSQRAFKSQILYNHTFNPFIILSNIILSYSF